MPLQLHKPGTRQRTCGREICVSSTDACSMAMQVQLLSHGMTDARTHEGVIIRAAASQKTDQMPASE